MVNTRRLIPIFISLLISLSACLPVATSVPPTSTSLQLLASSAPTKPALPTITSTSESTLTATPASEPTAGSTMLSRAHPILKDLRVRQAIAYCTDRVGLIRSVYPWLTDLAPFEADSFLPPNHWAYIGDDPDFTHYPFSHERGMSLLEEAGWKSAGGAAYRTNAKGDELALILTTTDSLFRQTWGAVWEEQMKTCGIRITRNHTPAAWFFGEDTGLRRRDFEIAAFAWPAEYDVGGLKAYSQVGCAWMPDSFNNWRGQNYSGWCNLTAETALEDVMNSLNREEQAAAFHVVQREYARDLPELPLFYRVSLFAVNPALENFVPTDYGIHTWNAAQWRIPGKDTIVIGEDAEPVTMFWFEQGYVTEVIRTLITGSEVIQRNFEYQPVLLEQIPSFENGGVAQRSVWVREGDFVVDWGGEIMELRPGLLIRDSNWHGYHYQGGALKMGQLAVTYQFVDGLIWSDGVPVSRSDYELAYRAMCDPSIRGSGPFSPEDYDPFPACDEIAGVDFLSDRAYRVRWKPGFTGSRFWAQDQPYFLPPIGRLPTHQLMDDGRKLADVPPDEWSSFEAVNHTPLGVGPYVIKDWVYGKRMVLEANPYYFQGPPATPHIVIKFLDQEGIMRALLAGEVDVMDWESIGPDDVENYQLLQAQASGSLRLAALPSLTLERLYFALTRPW